jgi:hypothetical protein
MSNLSWTVYGLSLLIVSLAGWIIYRIGYEVGWHEGKDEADTRIHKRATAKRRESALDGQ